MIYRVDELEKRIISKGFHVISIKVFIEIYISGNW